MKNKLFTCFFTILIIYVFWGYSYASTNTQDRTLNNLHINKDISVTSSNRQIILETPYVDASEKIYDFADLFSENEEQKLYEQTMDFIEKENLDIVIVTIDYNNKSSAMAYADDFYDYNDFGIGNNYSGLLLLIDMDTRNIWISTSGDAINKFSNDNIDSILNKIQPHAKNGNYYKCASNFIYESCSHNTKNYFYNIFNCIGVSVIIASVFCAFFIFIHKPVKKDKHASNYLDKSTIKITNRKDSFISSHTSKTSLSSSSGHGGSTHSGSSGRSHGGGGRSF